MSSTSACTDARHPATADRGRRRRNRAEALVRHRLEPLDDVYVLSSSWRQNGGGPEPLVAVIARDEQSRDAAREALADIAGFPADGWLTSWRRLSLEDWMVWVYPERAAA